MLDGESVMIHDSSLINEGKTCQKQNHPRS